MDHFPRFRRSRKGVAMPISLPPSERTDVLGFSGKTTAPPGNLHVEPTNANGSSKAPRRLSPFRFHLRSSHKRARDSPPASLPQSPTAAAIMSSTHESAFSRPVSSHALTVEKGGDDAAQLRSSPHFKIPSFLELSEQDIQYKFGELVWLERNRIAQSVSNPSPEFRWARVQGPHLKHLDRYMNIQPWQNNRVKLSVPDGQIDYVNASPIVLQPTPPRGGSCSESSRTPDRYIAMQGPKQTSMDHVWRMVVEQLDSPGVIVMLTETHEANIEKCYQYFPREPEDPPLTVNDDDEFGDGFYATVRCDELEETPAGDAIELRKLVIRVHSRWRKKRHANGSGVSDNYKKRSVTPEPASVNGDFDLDSDMKMKSPTADIREGFLAQNLDDRWPEGSQLLNGDRKEDQQDVEVLVDEDSQDGDSQDEDEMIEERIVWHFLYKKWPDFGAPAPENLDSFFTLMRLSREKNASPSNPRIVHCSAGVGRSGTFIALEYLMRELDSGALEHWDEKIWPAQPDTHTVATTNSSTETLPDADADADAGEGGGDDDGSNSSGSTVGPANPNREEEGDDLVFSVVNQLREQRKMMVQADSQYLFIYQVMRKLWLDKYGGLEQQDGEPAAKRLEVDPFVEGARGNTRW